MLSTLKAPSFALLLLTILSVVWASPFNSVWDNEDAHVRSLESRANGGKYVGFLCRKNEECYSRNCAPQGSTKTCQRQPAGGPCFKDSNCLTFNCNLSNGTCVTPAQNLPPRSVCETNSSCTSKRCLSSIIFAEEAGAGFHHLDGSQGFDPPVCDYLNIGEGKCKTSSDCKSGLCKAGKCQYGKDGDRCLYSYQCADICGADSRCVTRRPKGAKYGYYELCHDNSDCLSNRCVRSYGTFNRTLPNNPSKTVQVPDQTCFYSDVGGACAKSTDCARGACVDQVCKLLDIGDACGNEYQCASTNCYQGTCGKATFLTPCETSDICYSGKCGCPLPNPYGLDCGIQACVAQPIGGTCRTDDDCGAYLFGNTCGADKTCKSG